MTLSWSSFTYSFVDLLIYLIVRSSLFFGYRFLWKHGLTTVITWIIFASMWRHLFKERLENRLVVRVIYWAPISAVPIHLTVRRLHADGGDGWVDRGWMGR